MTTTSDLIERTQESQLLTGIITEAKRGTGSVGLVTGPVASGKSALLRVLCDEASEAGITVLRAAGGRTEHRTPMSIVDQVFQQAPLAAEAQLLLDEARRAALPHPAHLEQRGSARQLPTSSVQALSAVLFTLSATTPLLICVDDAHQADSSSLEWLLFLIRRLGTARIAVVLAEPTTRQHPHPVFRAELLRQPHCHWVMLAPLSHDGVVRLLGTQLDSGLTAELAPQVDALTSGNPLLVHALLEDLRTTTRLSCEQRAEGLGAGYAFSQAVVSCLRRSEPAALEVARGIAVFGEHSSPDLLGRLLGLSPRAVESVIGGLDWAGIVTDGRFGHPAVRNAVLRDTDPAELSRLHQHAARLLYAQSAPERAIAEQLLASHEPGGRWSTRVLCDVTEQALLDGDAELARRCVEHALRGCADPHDRAKVLVLQAGVEWQLQGDATRQLPLLTAALQAGELTDRHSMVVVKYLLRHGRLTEASRMLEQVLARGHEAEGRTLAELETVKLLFSSSYPGALPSLPPFGVCVASQDSAPAAVRADPQLQAAATLDQVLSGRADENTFLGAEQMLRSAGLTYRHWEQVEFALHALIYGDRLDQAALCCEQLLNRTEPATEGWRTPLLALHSLIAVRQGRLVEAEQYATTALKQMPWRRWGVNIGLPLATLLMARTLMGKYEDAAEVLSCPVPQTLYKTRYGLHYLYARGEYRLATNHPLAALEDFLICGEMMQEWDLDLPGVLPWRGGAAWAHLRLGNHQQAKALIDAQAKRLQPGPSRSRGSTMRLVGAVSDLKNRPTLLRQAVNELQRSGSRVDLALALSDLGHAHQDLGDHKRSRIMVGRAWQLAKEHSAAPVQRGLASMFSDVDGAVEVAEPAATPAYTDVLSDAERRVASLAVLGHTNREIARELFITVSTVEQHLTRIYRKLKINRRSNLPRELCLTTTTTAS